MGQRACAGQTLARFLIERLLGIAIERLPNLRVDPSAEAPRYIGDSIPRWSPLCATFDAR
jgi:cytochrome P450